jgi:hypothetical protein
MCFTWILNSKVSQKTTVCCHTCILDNKLLCFEWPYYWVFKRISHLLFQLIRCSWFWLAHFLVYPTLQKCVTCLKIRTSCRSFCWFSTLGSPTSKTDVKPRTNRKHNIWWCSSLHKVQFCVIVSLRNRTGHLTIVRHIPAVYVYSSIILHNRKQEFHNIMFCHRLGLTFMNVYSISCSFVIQFWWFGVSISLTCTFYLHIWLWFLLFLSKSAELKQLVDLKFIGRAFPPSDYLKFLSHRHSANT